MDLTLFIILIAVAYFIGSTVEKRHFKSIREREQTWLNIPMVNQDFIPDAAEVQRVELVSGSVVVSADYFKKTLSTMLSLIGGNIAVAESVLDRARREAVLRMREQAPDANMVVQMRIQTCELFPWQVEAIAYGTAVYYNR